MTERNIQPNARGMLPLLAGFGVALIASLVAGETRAEPSPRLFQQNVPALEATIINPDLRPPFDGASYDSFGRRVAIDGDTAVVGAPFDEHTGFGSVYIFVRSGGTWQRGQKLISPTPIRAQFGRAVAISGDVVMVGSPLESVNASEQGVVDVFRRVEGEWMHAQRLVASDAGTNDVFGWSLSLSGSTLLVGAWSHDTIGQDNFQGAAYVFESLGTTWVQRQKLTAPLGEPGDYFGQVVSTDGASIVVGAPSRDVGGSVDQGEAYLYRRSGADWLLHSVIRAVDGQANDRFGSSVLVDSNSIYVGAYLDDEGARQDQGSLYIFERVNDAVLSRQKLQAALPNEFGYFGYSLAVRDDLLFVGGYGFGTGAATGQGAVHVFDRVSLGWQERELPLVVAEGAPGDAFGVSIGLSGQSLIVGAYLDDLGPNTDQGTAHIFVEKGGAWSRQGVLHSGDGTSGDAFGAAVAHEAQTLAVGMPHDGLRGVFGEGPSVHIYRLGGGAPKLQQRIFPDDIDYPYSGYGSAVAVSGETIVVGAHSAREGGQSAGAAYVYEKQAGQWNLRARLGRVPGSTEYGCGFRVAIVGDRLLVGCRVGRVAYLFRRLDGIWTLEHRFTSVDETAVEYGSEIALGPDLVAIGSPGNGSGISPIPGSVYVYVKLPQGWVLQQRLFADDGQDYDQFGSAIAVSEDTMLVGASYDRSDSGAVRNSAYIFERSSGQWQQRQKLSHPDRNLGSSLDIDHDFATLLGGGRVHLFERLLGVWTLTGTLSDPAFGGLAPSTDSQRVVIPARYFLEPGAYGNPETGAVHVYLRSQIFRDGFDT